MHCTPVLIVLPGGFSGHHVAPGRHCACVVSTGGIPGKPQQIASHGSGAHADPAGNRMPTRGVHTPGATSWHRRPQYVQHASSGCGQGFGAHTEPVPRYVVGAPRMHPAAVVSEHVPVASSQHAPNASHVACEHPDPYPANTCVPDVAHREMAVNVHAPFARSQHAPKHAESDWQFPLINHVPPRLLHPDWVSVEHAPAAPWQHAPSGSHRPALHWVLRCHGSPGGHALWLVIEQNPSELQQAPSGPFRQSSVICTEQVVPAPNQNPPHCACVMYVQVLPVQHAPSEGHGFGEHVSPGAWAPAHNGGVTYVQFAPAQHAPHGVSVQLPPFDHAPPSPPQMFWVVNAHPPAEQHVPQGVLMHVVPAPPQFPAHALRVVTLQSPFRQHTPVGCEHGLGEHDPPCVQLPPQFAWITCEHATPAQHVPTGGCGHGLGVHVVPDPSAPAQPHALVSVHCPVAASQHAYWMPRHNWFGWYTPPAYRHTAGSVSTHAPEQQHAPVRITEKHGAAPLVQVCPCWKLVPMPCCCPICVQVDWAVKKHPTCGATPKQHAPNWIPAHGFGLHAVPTPWKACPRDLHSHSFRRTHPLNWQHAPC